MRRLSLIILVLSGVLGLSGCQVVVIGFPVVVDGVGPVDTPTSSAVGLSRPLAMREVLGQEPCDTAPGNTLIPDAKHQTCYLLDAPFLTVHRLDSITVLPQDGTLYWLVDLKLTPTDSLVLDNWTAANIGKEFAMVSGGAAVAEPTVQGALSTDEMLLSGPFTQSDATTMQQRITGTHS